MLVSGVAQGAGPTHQPAKALLVNQIIDAAAGDWNADGLRDLAILADSSDPDEEIGLYVYLRDADTEMLKQVVALPNRFWGRTHAEGGMFGQSASITALGNGSIAIETQNTGVGRSAWQSKVSVAFRNGQFIVAGYTHSEYDKLQQEKPLDCDLNLLSGKGTVNKKPVTFTPMSLKIEDWHEDSDSNPVQRICRNS